MEVLYDADGFEPLPRGSAVTIGAYDGVHLGHRKVISHVREVAAKRDLASVVATFACHPASVVRPESAPLLLTGLEQKLELLESTGVDKTVVLQFDEERAKEEARHFVKRVLVDWLRAELVVIGEDFHFGHNRGGNVPLLEEVGVVAGFEVTGLGLVGTDGHPARDHEQVSSTAIRRALASGRLASANDMLGRHYEVRGLVRVGDQRGHDLGFPTANVAVDDEILIPADGVYAGWYERPTGEIYQAAISVGTRPTFYDDGHTLVEAHLLDFDGDLYGEHARVGFVVWLRDQVSFGSPADLVAQLERDVDDARSALS